ncbi:hypothetical protein GUJ93_ZPchr0010g9029 [Zizania palustris]|uniref:Myb/SANT-like domain-containing protein n=1 Tax=Zizania palustris TaxID=103762 RepID=A0A8J5TIE4_ZIZPA|nr:hypothetical protein GUJ93_ZPchr0010g9029 [Zizania palustris]
MDKALLDTFVEYYNKGDICQNGWKSHVYMAAIKNVREKCNVEITKDNIMSRNKTFDKHHTIINGMLETSGFGWDWNKNKISIDSDSVWEAYVVVSFSFFCFCCIPLCFRCVVNRVHLLEYVFVAAACFLVLTRAHLKLTDVN